MSSTTIRYSTLPENSQSISLASAHPPHSDPLPDPAPDQRPPRLRHRPGDTFEIGGRPHDPLGPGPYGSPGWFQDRRTGRHRRGELPDPLPDAQPSSRPVPEIHPAPGADDTGALDLPPGPPPGAAPLTPPPEPSPDVRPHPTPSPVLPVDEARPNPYRRRRWDGSEQGSAYDPRHGTGSACRDADTLHRFSPLREGAMQRFLELSQPFRDAHFQPQPPAFGARVRWLLRWLLCIAACGLLPAPRRLAAECRPVLANANAADAGSGIAAATACAANAGGGSVPSGVRATSVGPSHLHGAPRQERPRSAAAQTPYIAAWEHRFDAQSPARSRFHLPLAGGGLL